MISKLNQQLFNRIKKKYFFNQEKLIHLKKDELIIESDTKNCKLFVVHKGKVSGYILNDSGDKIEVFLASESMFFGVHSFFSNNNLVYANVVALEECEVLYIEKDDLKNITKDDYENDFMPLISYELSMRQQFSRDLMIEKELVIKKMYQRDKLVALGQMAAGLAHELNNAIGVINGNVNWISKEIANYLCLHESNCMYSFFNRALINGQTLSCNKIREQKHLLMQKFGISSQLAKILSKFEINSDQLKGFDFQKNEAEFLGYYKSWQLGIALHDLKIASNHSVHILNSIKQLSATGQSRDYVHISESINEALTLLKNMVERTTVCLEINETSKILANNGELVQIWLNIIKNACESMFSDDSIEHKLHIIVNQIDDYIQIEISDNGPGISSEIRKHIFQPNYTTKKDGLSFGLGLGLSIVQGIVDSYNGEIGIKSSEKITTFSIRLPIS